jgi:hypothetical protein
MSFNPPESEEAARARRRRSLFIALGLAAFVVIVFAVTIVKMKANVGSVGF